MKPVDIPVLLTRIEPSRNMARFYALSVEPTLFAGLVVHRIWGRLWARGRSHLVFSTIFWRPRRTSRNLQPANSSTVIL
ncbi:WGR domain-containing protein [Roseibium sp.]|uniref:WGR domain-containing protein n=1 Tax=Roseibium sp. TaxID=1936156 RepID=UPI003D0C8ED4